MKSILKKQFEFARSHGWLPLFADAARRYDFKTADLLAVASRESNLRNIKGDFHGGKYHGYSLMQLDINSHRTWIESGRWQDPAEAIRKGAEALAEKRAQILQASKQKIAKVKFQSGKVASFKPKFLLAEDLRHCTLSAYNCGLASYYHFSIGNDIDRGTTQKNYGRDVLTQSAIFESFLQESPVVALAGPAETVAEQEEQESAALASPAEQITKETAEPDVDLLSAAVKSEHAKTAGKTILARSLKHSTAALTFFAAMSEAQKIGIVVICLVLLCGLAWLIYHNRVWVRAQVAKVRK